MPSSEQSPPSGDGTRVFPLWEGAVPLARGSAAHDCPTLTAFPPPSAKPKGPALLILTGGGYSKLVEHEGAGYARWFAERGFHCFVLKYRLGSDGYRHPAMLLDASRALRYLRAHAVAWDLDPQRIGVIGSSAGGHLAATLLTKFDDGDPQAQDPVERASSRPDLGILCYAVITCHGEFAQRGTRANLLGPDSSDELNALLSAQDHVTSATPPCFIWHTVEDPVVPVENSLLFASALRRAGVPFALHLYERGRHGLGLEHPAWSAEALHWLGMHWPAKAGAATAAAAPPG